MKIAQKRLYQKHPLFNVTAKGENGVLIHGNADNVIEDVIFENCRGEAYQNKQVAVRSL